MTELNDDAGPELSREFDFDKTKVGTGGALACSGAWFGHPREDARSGKNDGGDFKTPTINCTLDQICDSLALRGLKISHKTIYQYIVNDKRTDGDLADNLRINGKRRYRSRNKIRRVRKIPNWVNVVERPVVVFEQKHNCNLKADLI